MPVLLRSRAQRTLLSLTGRNGILIAVVLRNNAMSFVALTYDLVSGVHMQARHISASNELRYRHRRQS